MFQRMCYFGYFFIFLINTYSYAVDFKIDLPFEKGRFQSYENNDNLIEDVYNTKEQNIDINTSKKKVKEINEEVIIQKLEIPQNKVEANSEIMTNLNKPFSSQNLVVDKQQQVNIAKNYVSFENPKCLTSNIIFWEKIYRDIDGDSVLFHDKERMEIIYGSVKLEFKNKIQALEVYTMYIKKQILNLAENINNEKKWNNFQKNIAKLWNKKEFTSVNLIKSADNIRSQTGLKSSFNAGVNRSLNYLPTIIKILKESNLPPEIAYLPHVESGYYPFAVSKVGAVGLWQIMPGTMKLLLGKNSINRRTDIKISTKAATKLLLKNYNATQSWPLALTAYNHGLYGILRAIKATNSKDLCTIINKYESPSFHFASSNFYAQFIAAKNVASAKYNNLAKSKNIGSLKILLATKN